MTETLLRSVVERLLEKKKTPGEAIGVVSRSRWQGRETITAHQERCRVVQCDCVLDLRERLSESGEGTLVLVTPLSTAEIGEDVRARLYKQQLHPVDSWTSLQERFKARQVDPSLRSQPRLAEAALEALGSAEPLPAASGILTADAVWQVVLQHRLGLDSAQLDTQGLLEWLNKEETEPRWRSLDGDLRGLFQDWLLRRLPEIGEILLRSLEAGYGGEAIPLGLALGALQSGLTGAKTQGSLGLAQGRLERFTGDRPLTVGVIRQWNDAAEQWAVRLCGSGRVAEVRAKLQRADQLLDAIGAIEFAINSTWSLLGFQQRLAAFSEALNGTDADRLKQSFEMLQTHEAASRLEELRGRRDRAEMAVRLCRWLDLPGGAAPNLQEAIDRYTQETCWVDWARHQLMAGDEPEAVSRSYSRLFERVTKRREEENRRFATLLADATKAQQLGTGVLSIEHVLDRVVAPLSKKASLGVLVIVMDGMSLAVLRELSDDLERHGWQERIPLEPPVYRSALSALPSVTSFSRATLLCGTLSGGSQGFEKRGFEEHSGLRAAGKASHPPILFHKDEIGASAGELAEKVRLEIQNDARRIVGVIVNVVDDSLEGPEQLSIRWTLEQVPVLRALLGEARENGRVVVLLSDHGHVLDHGSILNRKPDASDRWRPVRPDQPPSSDELLVSGPRVLAEGQHFISPKTEAIRYTPNRRQGYHGGLTPQECLAPISVIASSLLEIEGWAAQSAVPPDWWIEGVSAPSTVSSPTVQKGRKGPKPSLPLFVDAPKAADWVAALLASEVFKQQMETLGGRLRKEQVEQALTVLAERNGVQMKGAFGQRIGMVPVRVDGLLASLQRILNVDGYAVLTVDSSQAIRINLPLLREQFEITEGA